MLKHYSRLLKISQPHFPISIRKGISWLKEKSDSKDLS